MEVVEVQTLQVADVPEPGDDESLGPLDVRFIKSEKEGEKSSIRSSIL